MKYRLPSNYLKLKRIECTMAENLTSSLFLQSLMIVPIIALLFINKPLGIYSIILLIISIITMRLSFNLMCSLKREQNIIRADKLKSFNDEEEVNE